MQPPNEEKLERIVLAHFRQSAEDDQPLSEEQLNEATLTDFEQRLIEEFIEERGKKDLATDQLLNALYLRTSVSDFAKGERPELRKALFRALLPRRRPTLPHPTRLGRPMSNLRQRPTASQGRARRRLTSEKTMWNQARRRLPRR